MYRFHWSDDFLKTGLLSMRSALLNDTAVGGLYLGAARCGDVCFDILARDERSPEEYPETNAIDHGGKQPVYLDFDLYVGGIDDGYGYSDRNPETPSYPYTNAAFVADDCGFGEYLEDVLTPGLDLEQFINWAEARMTEFLDGITNEAARAAIARPFHFW